MASCDHGTPNPAVGGSVGSNPFFLGALPTLVAGLLSCAAGFAQDENLLPNPDFDTDSTGWTFSSTPSSQVDANNCPLSTSRALTGTSFDFSAAFVYMLSDCINLASDGILFQEVDYYSTDNGAGEVALQLFAAPDCAGAFVYDGAGVSSTPAAGFWYRARRETAAGALAGVASVRFVALTYGLPLSSFQGGFDRAYLGFSERVFVDGFDGGAACRWGPDVSPPTSPAPLTSSSHPTGVPTADSTIFLEWTESTDLYTRVERYYVEINVTATPPACTALAQTLPAPASAAFAPDVPAGTYYVHLCAQDTVGNVTEVTSLGPLIVID
jgi:hypothetical protein